MNLFNTDYLGDVKYGNSLKIATVTNPSVSDYTKGGTISYESVQGSPLTLNIDNQKYWSIKVDDIDSTQSAVNLIESATLGAGAELSKTIDEYLAGQLESGAEITGTITTENLLDSLAVIMQKLDETNTPDGSRWCVVPPSVARYLVTELAGKLTNNEKVVSSGYLGSIFGLDIYKSNSTEKVLAGSKESGTFALQLSESEMIRLPDTFANGVRGLAVYGSLITRPETVCCYTIGESGD